MDTPDSNGAFYSVTPERQQPLLYHDLMTPPEEVTG